MKKLAVLFVIIGYVAVSSALKTETANRELTINLRWIKGHPTEKWSDAETGLQWSLSYLGATLPKGCCSKAISRIDSSLFTADLSQMGFSEKAQIALESLIHHLKQSEEYKIQGAIDLGRFIVFTQHCSWHYYAITEVPQTLEEFRKGNNVTSCDRFPVTRSGVSKNGRLIRFTNTSDYQDLAFFAEHGPGDITKENYKGKEFEVFDLMPNGQLRFAIYDETGKLLSNSDPELSHAGKPGKCQWCHEINIQSLFVPTDSVSGCMSPENFTSKVNEFQKIVNAYRATLTAEIDYKKTQDHTLSELLYISFMEPSAERLAQEWGSTVEQVQKKLRKLTTHEHEEFKFFGQLYHRADVDRYSPYKSVRVPGSVRERSSYEPNILSRTQR